jgi:drug/metabolite transporter (DMT)-like permease
MAPLAHATDGAALRRGVALALVAVALFTGMMALVKWLSASFAPMQVGFFRASCALAFCLPVVLADAGWRGLRTRQPGAYVLRGLCGVGAIVLSFHGVALMPIADWIAITFLVPLFVAALSAPMLGEHVGGRRWAAILVGFAGVLIIVPPTGQASAWALAVGVASQATVAMALVLIRRLGDAERTTTIVFYYMLALTLITSVLAPFDWRMPVGTQWLLLALVGVIAGAGHLLLTAAYKLAPASVIAPFDYSSILWAVLLGWFVWAEAPGLNLFLGAPLVILSGLYVVLTATRRAPA